GRQRHVQTTVRGDNRHVASSKASVSTLGAERAAIGAGDPPWSSLDVLLFEVAGRACALPVADVREVLPLAALTPLPEGPAVLAGLLRVRGLLVPVIDARLRLGMPAASPRASQRIVLLDLGGRVAGLWVDAVQGVVSLEEHG